MRRTLVLQNITEPPTANTLNCKIRVKGKKEKYISLKQQMHTEQSKQVSTTDADTRLMQGPDGGTLVGYNIQCTNDTKHSLIVDFAVTNEGDRHALYHTSVSAKAILGVETLTVIADKGYHCPTELAACKRDNIITLVAPQEYFIPNAVPDQCYHADNFIYDKAQDCYSCPQGNKLVTNGTWLKRKKQLGKQETEALYKPKFCTRFFLGQTTVLWSSPPDHK